MKTKNFFFERVPSRLFVCLQCSMRQQGFRMKPNAEWHDHNSKTTPDTPPPPKRRRGKEVSDRMLIKLIEFMLSYYNDFKEVFTARIRRMREGNIFSLFVSSHLDRGGGGYPIQLRGVPPSQVWTRGGLPHPADRGGTPFPGLGRVPHPADGGGYPPGRVNPPPPPDQHSMYLLRGERCASCVHAGGLSCLEIKLKAKAFISGRKFI